MDDEPITPAELVSMVEVVDPADLELLEGNPNVGDLPAIDGSMRTFGQLEFVLVRDGVVVSGNHRVMTAVARDEHAMAVVNLDKLGRPVTDTFVNAAAVALNAIARRAEWDEPAMGEWLLSIAAEDESLIGVIGIDDDEYEAMVSTLLEDDDPPPPGDSSTPTGVVRFTIGDYRGVIADEVYVAFRSEVERRRGLDPGAVLSDILGTMLAEMGRSGG